MVEQERISDRVRKEVEVLAGEFRGIFGIETIQRCADACAQQFEQARVTDFVPLLVYKSTRELLRDAAQARNSSPSEGLHLLFVCTKNAGRSQMAAALANELGGGRLAAVSAGTAPSERVQPLVVQAMADWGIDLTAATTQPLTEDLIQQADVIVAMGCGDAPPLLPGKRYFDWQVDDPDGESLDGVRRIRDTIHIRVRAVLEELGVFADAGATAPVLVTA